MAGTESLIGPSGEQPETNPEISETGPSFTLIQGVKSIMEEQNTLLAHQKQQEERRLQNEKNEALARLAGSVAHHFNNKLSVVLGNLEMVLEDVPDQPEIQEKLRSVQKAARDSSALSRWMLTYLGQNAGPTEALDLSLICRNLVPDIQRTLPQGAALETDFRTSGPTVAVNPGYMEEVINQLAANAVEALSNANGHGKLRLATRVTPLQDIPECGIRPADWIPTGAKLGCLEFSDTGSGIPDDHLSKIFDPFFSTKCLGRGLGLSGVFGLVRAWNGCIRVESRPDQGSLFQVFLPLIKDTKPERDHNSIEGRNTA